MVQREHATNVGCGHTGHVKPAIPVEICEPHWIEPAKGRPCMRAARQFSNCSISQPVDHQGRAVNGIGLHKNDFIAPVGIQVNEPWHAVLKDAMWRQ